MAAVQTGVFANSGEKCWLEKSRSPAYVAWAGYSVENLCLTHLPWIQRALRLEHIGYEAGSWNHVPLKGSATHLGAQIDQRCRQLAPGCYCSDVRE